MKSNESIRSNEEEIADEEERSRSWGTVTGGTLNLRLSKSTGSTLLDTIPNGTSLNVVKADNTWLTTVYNNKVGFVQSQYVNVSGLTYNGQGISPVSAGIVNSDGVNVRVGPGTNYGIATNVKNRGNIVTVVGVSLNTSEGYYWDNITPSGASSQWIRGDYVAPY
jgi:uncharacterized protein YgiM (DUF1202 family)